MTTTTFPQKETILKITDQFQSAYDLGANLITLDKLYDKKLLLCTKELGSMFFPKVGTKWKLSPEGIKYKENLINDFNNFFENYLVCALWSSTYGDDDKKNIDDDYDTDDIEPQSKQKLENEARNFFLKNYELIIKGNIGRSYEENIAQAGHDFWLTRNHHGAGFWETPDWKPSQGKKLTENAQNCKELYLYVENDKIYADL